MHNVFLVQTPDGDMFEMSFLELAAHFFDEYLAGTDQELDGWAELAEIGDEVYTDSGLTVTRTF